MAYDPTTDVWGGGGKLYIQTYTTGVAPAELSWVDMGNIKSYTREPSITKKKHKSHRASTAETDLVVKVGQECMLKMTLDSITQANLLMYFEGVLSGATIKPLEKDVTEYSLKFVPDLINGTEYTEEWLRCYISPTGALEGINHGDGEDDWQTMEFEVEALKEENPPAGYGYYGKIYPTPTA